MTQLGHSPEASDFNNQLEGLNLLGKNTKLKETESLVLNDKDKKKYEGKEVKGVKGLLLCEDSSTKKVFLSDGYRPLTQEFDNIKSISKEGNDIYYIGVNGGKSTLYKSGKDIIIGEGKLDYRMRNGKMETVFEKDEYVTVLNDEPDQEILSNVDDIDYRMINGELVTIAENNGKKTVKRGEKFIGESCNEAIFKDITDDSNQGRCIYIEKGGKAKVFIDGKQYGPEISSLDIKNNPRCLQVSKCGDDYMIICDCRMNTHDRPNNTIIYKGKIMYTGLNRAIPNDVRKLKCYDKFGLGDRNVIVVKKGNGKEELYDTKLGKIGTEYDSIDLYSGGEDNCDWIDGEYVATKDHLLLYAKKNGKDILIVDGEDYELSDYNGKFVEEMEFDRGFWMGDDQTKTIKDYSRTEKKDVSSDFSLNTILFLKKGGKSYYIGQDYILHEFEGKYDNISYVRETSDGKTCFIGKQGNKEYFVFNGEVQGKGYDHISGAGVLPGGGVYVQAERDGEKVFILNGTEREEPTFLDRKTILFKREKNDY